MFPIYLLIFTRGQFLPSGIVGAFACVSVRLCVRVCVCVVRTCPRYNL